MASANAAVSPTSESPKAPSHTSDHLSPWSPHSPLAADITSDADTTLLQTTEADNAPTLNRLNKSPTPQSEGTMPAPNRPVDSARGTKSRSGTADSSLRSSADPLPRSTRRSRARSTRKSSTEIEDSMEKDPDLWGLRRSKRSKPARRIIETTSDEDDDNDDDAAEDISEVSDASDDVKAPSKKRRKIAKPTRRASKRATPARPTTYSADSDSDAYETARQRGASKRKRQSATKSTANLGNAQGEIRFSTRSAKKVHNYNEDDDGSEMEDIMTPEYPVSTPADDSPTIEAVLKYRLKDSRDINGSNRSRDDYDYLIKWKGTAHYHATWESSSDLSSYRGYRKLENYFRKRVLYDIEFSSNPAISLEEKETWVLDRERESDTLEGYLKVERVIGSREGESDTEYYVKWRGLSYDSCTWEPASLVTEIAPTQIDWFLQRAARPTTSSKTEANRATRREHRTIREQPSYIQNGELKDFQITGLNFLAYNWCKGRNVLLADEMGLGKTVQTVAFMNWMRHDRQQEGPFIVVAPLSTLPAWAETMDYWTPDLNYVVYNGDAKARNIIKEYELLVGGNCNKVKFNVLLTTFEYVLADAPFLSQIKWQFMAIDEAHRLKNKDSQLYARLQEFKAPSRLLITGTPIQNNLGELTALMNFLDPGFVKVDEKVDLQSEGAGKTIAELTEAIQPYMLRRTKRVVERDLPPKKEHLIRVYLSDVQVEYYQNIMARNYEALNQGSTGQKQSLLNVMMELKKASNHPFLFPNAEERILNGAETGADMLKSLITSSGKMMVLDHLLAKMKKDNHRVLIFSQMVMMLDIIGDYLKLRGYQFQRIDGNVPVGARRMAIDHYNAPDSNDFCFLLSTRAGGLGINLMTADVVIIFDSDWNPQADLQAMARAHRIGQKKPVQIYRLISRETVEEEVIERARNKLMLEFLTIHRGVTDQAAKEFSDQITSSGRSVEEPTRPEDISRILKRRGKKIFEQSGNQKKLEELDVDTILANAEEHRTELPEGIKADGGEEFLKSFEYTDVEIDLTWDQIIPKDQLEAIKKADRQKAEAQFLLEIADQEAPRIRKAATESREQRAAKRAKDFAVADGSQDTDTDEEEDPKRPLSEKELRNLFRAFVRYGSLERRGEELLRDAHLVGRDIELIKEALTAITEISKRSFQEEQDRVAAIERENNKTLTKKDKKAVLFDYKGVKRLNAETILERPGEMAMLQTLIEAVADPMEFRIPEATKPATYSCSWGPREDGMLCVGIHRHGFGAWVQIRDDPDLGMEDKLFLEEHRVDKKEERTKGEDKTAKSPGAVHLVRRADYLLSVLKEKTSEGTNVAAKRAVENHHRNSRKNGIQGRRSEKSVSVSASPAPGARKPGQDRRNTNLNPQRDLKEKRPVNGEAGHQKGAGKRKNNYDSDAGQRKRRKSDEQRSGAESPSNEYEEPRKSGLKRKSTEMDNEAGRMRRKSHEDQSIRDSSSKDGHGPPKKNLKRKSVDTDDESRKRHKSEEPQQRAGHTANGVAKLNSKPSGQANGGSQELKPQSEIDDARLKRLLEPISDNLSRLQNTTKTKIPNELERVRILRKELTEVGKHVESILENKDADAKAEMESQLWTYVCGFLPSKKTKTWNHVQEMYRRQAAKIQNQAEPGEVVETKE